nr:DNA-directed DNA polymerase [Tanacetum cinerariifolium]
MPSEYQQDYKKTRAYAPKIYNDPNMSDAFRDIYRTLESRYVHKGRTIDPSFYNDLNDDSVAKFTAIEDNNACIRLMFWVRNDVLVVFVEVCDSWIHHMVDLEEQPNERTPLPPPRKKSLSPPQAPSKSISSKSTHYTSSSSPSESPAPSHVAPPPKLCFVISIKLEPQELLLPQISPNDPYVQTMDNWPPGPYNPSSPPRVSRPPLGFLNLPPELEPSNLIRLPPDAVANSLTPSLEKSRRRRFMLATLSPHHVSTILQEIWCRSVVLSVSSPNERKETTVEQKAKAMIFLRHHLHENLKIKYLTVKDPLVLWDHLKDKYEHTKGYGEATIVKVAPMADNQTIEELLQAPTKGFEETFGEAWERFKEMLRAYPHNGFTELTQIDTFYNGLNENYQDSLNAAAGENLLSKTTREALQIIKNKSKVRYSRNKPNVSRMNMTSRENASKTDDRIDKLADQNLTLVDIFAKKVVTPTTVKAVKESCVPCGGNHAYYNCDANNSNQSSVCAEMGTYNQVAPQNRVINFMAPPGFASVQNNNQSRFYQNQGQGNNFNWRNNFHGNQSFQVLNQGFQNQPFQVPNNQVQQGFSNEFLNYKKPTDQMMRNMQNQINSLKEEFKNEIQNTMKTQQNVLMEQQKAFQNNLQNILSGFFQNQSSTSAMLLKKLPEKLGDPGKFLIPCDFPRMDLSVPKLTPTRMTLELADRSITHPKGVTEDVFVKVGKFHFPIDFVVDFEADPRVPLILGRSFLRTGRALIDVYGEEISLRVNDEAITFNLNQTTRYSSTYDDMSVNRIDIIDVAREEYAQEMLDFYNNFLGGNPTSTSEPIIFYSSPSLTRFEGSDFILEEIEAYLKDESISSEIDHADYNPEGDICLIEKLLNDNPFQLPPMDLKQGEIVKAKYSIEEPSDLKLKDLPSHLEYAYL